MTAKDEAVNLIVKLSWLILDKMRKARQGNNFFNVSKKMPRCGGVRVSSNSFAGKRIQIGKLVRSIAFTDSPPLQSSIYLFVYSFIYFPYSFINLFTCKSCLYSPISISKASCRYIRIFLNPQRKSYGFKNIRIRLGT